MTDDEQTKRLEKLKKDCWSITNVDILMLLTLIDEQRGEIERLNQWVNDLQSGMSINCVYCGHKYGPDPGTPITMQAVLYKHIAQCPKHPLTAERAKVEQLESQLTEAKEEIERQRCAYVEQQKHRDHWRGYAYGKRDKPQDFLDGNMTDRPATKIEQLESQLTAKDEEIERLNDEINLSSQNK